MAERKEPRLGGGTVMEPTRLVFRDRATTEYKGKRIDVGANDTPAAVGYVPLTETERLVFAAERYLNLPEFKKDLPQAGEDARVMGYRRGHELVLTVAVAFADRSVLDTRVYFARTQEIQSALEKFPAREQRTLDRITLSINTPDEPSRGEGGVCLTVLGTSAEGGDCR